MIVNGRYTYQSGYMVMKDLLEKVPDLDGVFCGNDEMAIGALKFLKERGKKVPQEIKLMGYDDVFLSTIVDPTISTIHIRKIPLAKKLQNYCLTGSKIHLIIRNQSESKWKVSSSFAIRR